MTERSLFNVICKFVGLWIFYEGITSLVWAFLASRFSHELQFAPSEVASWYSGAVSTAFGLLLCGRSSWVTQVLFGIDGPVGEGSEAGGAGVRLEDSEIARRDS